jgi:uncharacterized damage-inducible protein DinB
MITPEYLILLYDYNSWAKNRVLSATATLTEEQLFASHGHGWDSIHNTLVHMMNAEWIWLERWKGTSPRSVLPFEYFPDLAAIRMRWLEVETDLRIFVSQQTPESLLREVNYTSTRNLTFHVPLWQLMVHVINHGTHHRGELAAMLAVLEIPHKEDDLYFYFLIQSGQMED